MKELTSNRTVVFAGGVFDLLHIGHIRLLRFAREQGTQLVVGINSDESVRRLKGPSRPIMSHLQRREMLEALRYVDQVYVFDEDTPCDLIKTVRPHIVVKGCDWKHKIMPEHSMADEIGFRIVFFEENIPTRTSTLIQRCTERVAS